MSQFKTKEFLRIQKHWYEILAKHGFVDQEIQRPGTQEFSLDRNESDVYRWYEDPTKRESKRIYYQLILEGLGSTKRMRQPERMIMERISDGSTLMEISQYLKEHGWDRWHWRTLRFIIRRWEHRWGVRTWKPHQMDANWKTRKK